MMPGALEASQVLGEATRLLCDGGFSQASSANILPEFELRVFEDDRSIVGLVLYQTWEELESNWPAAQAVMVELMSEKVRPNDPKSWDGYLVLLTVDESARAGSVTKIKNDTSRLRKLVATGREMKTMASVKDALRPVLPFDMASSVASSTALTDRIPEMLEDHGIERSLATAAIMSFQENRSPMEGVWIWRQEQ